ncbi:MAG: saccharopine dehydrogenase NADP-binding domain-containing protein [Rhodomicrobium sp.]
MNAKPYDVIVFGAASFVGKLLCGYLSNQFNAAGLRWAAAGRSREKLEQMRRSLNSKAVDIPLIIADAADERSLTTMCAQTAAVVSTVGPYALYGEPLVKVCAELGTDYCDLTGEVQWIRRMLDRYEKTAQRTGARVIHCCGFDSVPSDLGVHFIQNHALERLGRYCTHIKMRVKALRGGVSGGTIASMVNVAKEAAANPALRKDLRNPYLLCPKDRRPSTRQESLTRPAYDADFQAWLAPFVMASINTRVVHRSNALANYAYGEDFRYDEAMLAGTGVRGRMTAYAIAGSLGGFAAMTAVQPARRVLQRFVLPAPGEGPSPESQKKGFYDLRFLGILDDGRTIRAKLTGDADPGYGSTSKMLGQVAACLANSRGEAKKGGFWTPATLFGDPLIDALQRHAGLSFTITEGAEGKPQASK